jgi:putative toxin-antitoxin system antitoxin component (TIGR02293 family)
MARTVVAPHDVVKFVESMNGRPPRPYDYAMLLGMKDLSWMSLLANIERGFPYSTLQHLQRNTGMAPEALSRWIRIAPRTMARRRSQGRFTPEESDRLLRAARVFACVLEMFHGDRTEAVEWLFCKPRALGGATPLDISRTELGASEVEHLIGRIRHGVYS